ncbi:large ribosomal subunit protein mL53 [Hyperolius riggenbachi]|uniref:large ribosomal subunit protein mL53 n=1 Tax=Hyperolius riggenbachi TaxID=752182 RepID=UPI0035A37B5D
MAAAKGIRLMLKPVRSIAVSLCPFESNVSSTREFVEAINSKKIRSTNNNCEITVDVRHDKSEPVVDISFVDGDRLFIKSANVTAREMLQKLSSFCDAKDPQLKDATKDSTKK